MKSQFKKLELENITLDKLDLKNIQGGFGIDDLEKGYKAAEYLYNRVLDFGEGVKDGWNAADELINPPEQAEAIMSGQTQPNPLEFDKRFMMEDNIWTV